MPEPQFLPPRRTAPVRYGIAIACVLIAAGVRAAFTPIFGDQFPFLTFMLAVLASAWFGGTGPAVLAATLGGAAAAFLFLPPLFSPAVDGTQNQLALVMYLVITVAIIVFGRAMQRAYERAAISARVAEGERLRVQHLLENIKEAFLAFDRDGRCVYANDKAVRLSRLPREELLGRVIWDRYPGTAGAELHEYHQRAISGQERVEFETYYAPFGQWFEVHLSPHDDGLLAFFQDVTARKESEAALRASEARFRHLAEAGRILAASLGSEETLANVVRLVVPTLADWCALDLLDADGSTRLLAVAHADPAKVELGYELRRRYPPQPDDRDGLMKVLRTGQPQHHPEITDEMLVAGSRDAEQLRIYRAIGIRSAIIAPLVARGRTLGALTLISAESGRHFGPADFDLAAGLAARAALAVDNARLYREAQEVARRADESRALLDALFQSAPVGLAFMDTELRYVRINPYLAAVDGVRPEEAIGRRQSEILPNLAPRVEPLYRQVLTTGEPICGREVTGETKAVPGWQRSWVVNYYPVRLGEGPILGVGAVVLEITERKEAEAALRESEERLRLALDAGQVGAWDWDIVGNRVKWSERVYEFHGLTPGSFGGRLEDFAALVHPDDAPRVAEAIRRAIQERTGYEVEFRAVRPDGAVRWLSTSGRAYFDATGQPVRMLGATIDTTARKMAEEALREADRRKDEFFAMLGHELRNPLAPIRNALHILGACGPGPDADEARAVIDRQVQHLTRLVDDLLDVHRVSRGVIQLQRDPVDLAAVVHAAVETARPLIDARRHRLTVDLPSGELLLSGDAGRLGQVVTNLLANAAKYTNPGGRVWLEVRREPTSPLVPGGRADGGEGGWAVLSVRDSGIGIPPEKLPSLFEMFLQINPTLDRAQGGLGVGLSLVKRLVELHGGTVSASSAGPGKGSEFVVRLPLMAPPLAAAPATTSKGNGQAGRSSPRRVLVVDDSRDAARTLAIVLRRQGHEVRTAHDGFEALDLAAEFRPEVVLLDIGLPGLDGYEVARRLRARSDGPRVILVALTGYGQEEDRRRSQEAGFDRHLVKPVSPDVLLDLLRTPVG